MGMGVVPVGTTYNQRYYFSLMKKYQNSLDKRIFLGYSIFIYDITQT